MTASRARVQRAHETETGPIRLRVYGVPVPQGSTRAFAVRKGGKPTGRVVVTGDNPRTRSWRQAILDAWDADAAVAWGPAEALVMMMTFVLPRPAGHFGTGRNAGRVRPSAPSLPVVKPDLDKLCRAVLDALTDAGAWRDDSQVVGLNAGKVYASPGQQPGVIIDVGAMGTEVGR